MNLLLLTLGNGLGFLGVTFAGHRKRYGWAVGFTSEIAWTLWGLTSHNPGIYPWAAIWAVVYARNWWSWRIRETKDAVPS